jgi:hypothetical protein
MTTQAGVRKLSRSLARAGDAVAVINFYRRGVTGRRWAAAEVSAGLENESLHAFG